MAAGCLVWAELVGVDVEHTQVEQRVEQSGPRGAGVRSFSAGDVT